MAAAAGVPVAMELAVPAFLYAHAILAERKERRGRLVAGAGEWAGEVLERWRQRPSAVYRDTEAALPFENFELREKYVPGQRFYFGLTRKTAGELLSL